MSDSEPATMDASGTEMYEDPDTSRFLSDDGRRIDFVEIITFGITLLVLFVTELWVAAIDFAFASIDRAYRAQQDLAVLLVRGPLEAGESGLSTLLLTSFEAAGRDIAVFEIFAFVVAALFVAAWFFTADRIADSVRRWL